ncbi:hypothetical protein Vafri_11265 [Volvox africanus]|nr:hypothetical protein Vafri_11265 [Volvox africanus]
MPVILTTEEEISAWLGEKEPKDKAGLETSNFYETDICANQKERDEGLIAAAAAADAAAAGVDRSPTNLEYLPRSPHSHRTAAGATAGAKAEATEARPGGGSGAPHEPSAPSSVGVKRRRPSLIGGGSLAASETKEAEAGAMSLTMRVDQDGGDKTDEGSEGGESRDEDRYPTGRGEAQSCQEVGRSGARGERGGSGTKGSLRLEAVKQQCEVLVEEICRPYGGPLLRWHPVTPEMSKPGYDKPDCCKDVRTKKGSIASFFKPAAPRPANTAATAAPMAGPTVKKEAQPQLQLPQQGLQAPKHFVAKETKEEKEAAEGKVGWMVDTAVAAAMARNTDACAGVQGRVSAGQKRPAEGEAAGQPPARMR